MLSSLVATVLLLPLGAAPDRPQTIERILAVVDRRPVFLSEVKLTAELQRVDERQALELLIDEVLMYQEARRFPQSRSSTDEEAQAHRDLLARVGQAAAGREGLLGATARRQATILRYVAVRFRPLVRVSDDELARAYEREYLLQPNPPTRAQVQAPLRSKLAAQALDQRIEAWVRELRVRARIRYNGPASPGPPPASDNDP
jgi:hypothetical protein